MDPVSAHRARDRALLDLADLDRQVADGELTEAEAEPLRRRYERAAADAIAALSHDDPAPAEGDRPVRPRRARGRLLAGLSVGVAAAVAAVLMPTFVADRPTGGYVTGNEVRRTATPAADPSSSPDRDLSKVSDAEMEAVIAANPDVLGMRLALARRYVQKGRYDAAVTQYLAVLQRDPANAVAQAYLGWVMFQTGQPQEALTLVDRALGAEPAMQDALWFKANILLYGTSDPAAAIAVLRTLEREQLTAEVRKQVVGLIKVARSKQGGG